MRTLESTGKSIDEAIFNGLRQLEVSIDEVEIDILQQESKGVLGFGVKPAIVRLIEREPEQIVIPEYLTEADRMRSGSRSGPQGDRRNNRRNDRPRNDRTQRSDRAPGEDRPREDRPREDRPREDRPREDRPREDRTRNDRSGSRNRPYREERETEPAIQRTPVDYSAEAAQNSEAAQFLKGMLELMGMEANVLANVSDENGIRLRIDSASMGILIGHRGETLDAMQYLTSLHANRTRKENGYTRVTIDTEGYRDKREDTLARLARKVAAQVRSTGRARTLEPMNPYERRVLHATLQNNPYVITYSEGEEPNRRVIVAPKKAE